LGVPARAEALAAADIDQENERSFALLDVALDEGRAHAGGDVPIDGSHIVAGLIFAYFFKRQTGAFEDGVILAAEQVLDSPASTELKAANLPHHLGGEHCESSMDPTGHSLP